MRKRPRTLTPVLTLPEPSPGTDLASIAYAAVGLGVHERDARAAIARLGIVPRFRFNGICYYCAEQWRDVQAELKRIGAYPEQQEGAE